MEKEFSEIRNSDYCKILLYSSYCFAAPLRSKSALLKLLEHELLLSLRPATATGIQLITEARWVDFLESEANGENCFVTLMQ